MRAWSTAAATPILALGLTAVLACGGPVEDRGRAGAERSLQSILATMASGQGGLQVKRRTLAFWEPASVGTTFMAGDWVQSGPGASARIEFVPGGRLDLDPGAIVVIDAQTTDPQSPGGPPTEALLAVETGVVRGVLRKSGQTVGIRAPDGSTARLISREGDGPVEYRLAKRPKGTEVAIHRGTATLASRQSTRELRAGQAADVAQEEVSPVVQLLEAPLQQQPEADAAVVVAEGGTLSLRWRAVARAVGYRIQLAAREDFQDVSDTAEVPRTELIFRPTHAGALFWRAAARDPEGRFGVYGPPRRLVVMRPATVELLQSPESGARLTGARGASVTFRWGTAPEGGYRFVVARGGSLEGATVADEVTLENSATLNLRPGQYTWGVYAFADESTARPLFLRPRTLFIDAAPSVSVPNTLKEWGQ